MAQIVAKYDEKFVNNTILYVGDIDDYEYLYHDAEMTKKVSRAEMLNILERGPVAIYYATGKNWVFPTEFVDGGSASYVYASVLHLVNAVSPATGWVAEYCKLVTKEYTA